MIEKTGNLIDLGGSLVFTIPVELRKLLGLTKDTKVVKKWDGHQLIATFYNTHPEPLIKPKLNSMQDPFKQAIAQWYKEQEEGK